MTLPVAARHQQRRALSLGVRVCKMGMTGPFAGRSPGRGAPTWHTVSGKSTAAVGSTPLTLHVTGRAQGSQSWTGRRERPVREGRQESRVRAHTDR